MFFFSSRRRHTRYWRDWSSDVCSSDLTAFLLDTGEHRSLFTGDTIVLDGDEWVAALLDSSDRDAYIKSLELIRGLDFDVSVPWAASLEGSYYGLTDKSDTKIGRASCRERV